MDIPSTVNCSLFLISIESSPDKIKSYDIICCPLLRPVSVSPCGRSRPRQWRVSATVSCCQLRAAVPLAASPGTTAPVPTSPGLGRDTAADDLILGGGYDGPLGHCSRGSLVSHLYSQFRYKQKSSIKHEKIKHLTT